MYTRWKQVTRPSELTQLYGAQVSITGTVAYEPRQTETNIKIVVRVAQVAQFNIASSDTAEYVLASISKFADVAVGDEVQVSGILRMPENFDNENGIEFDYVNFLAKDRIFSLIHSARFELVHRPTSFILSRTLFDIKNFFLNRVSTVLPSPHAELLGGLLLGVKQSLGRELETDFRRVGLIHVVVLSGYNITIILVAVFALLNRFSRAVKYVSGTLFVILFALMVGLGSTVVRSTIMAVIAILGKVSGRDYHVNRALFFAALVMVSWNPMILFHDPSFQLSFLATFGLINFSERVGHFLRWLPERFGFKDIVTSTLATQIAVLPLILQMTGELSLIALPVNVIVLPFIPATMLFGFVTGVCAVLSWHVGFVVGFFAYVLLAFELWMVETFSALPFAVVQIPAPTATVTILFYCFAVIFFYDRPIEVCKKVRDVIRLTARMIVGNK